MNIIVIRVYKILANEKTTKKKAAAGYAAVFSAFCANKAVVSRRNQLTESVTVGSNLFLIMLTSGSQANASLVFWRFPSRLKGEALLALICAK